ncbi:hypothetical protein TNCV_1595951 [Trichonephila clavipes]|nr:hypothetical protein TNCV_1595951 [Trichonephila clavipes]
MDLVILRQGQVTTWAVTSPFPASIPHQCVVHLYGESSVPFKPITHRNIWYEGWNVVPVRLCSAIKLKIQQA